MKICALIPAFNEVDTIASVVEGTLNHVDHVIVIDDGSEDGTAAAAIKSKAECIRLSRNCGKGTALRRGIEKALDSDFTHLLFLDGDSQHRPEDIPSLVNTAEMTNVDMVIGERTFNHDTMPRERYFSNSVGSKVASWLVGRQIRDSQCGFRLIRSECLRQLRLRSKKYEIEMEILIKLSRKGCSIEHAPVAMIYEDGKAISKMKPVRDTVRICIWSLIFRFLGL